MSRTHTLAVRVAFRSVSPGILNDQLTFCQSAVYQSNGEDSEKWPMNARSL